MLHYLRRRFDGTPALIGAMLTFMGLLGVVLLLSPWFDWYHTDPGLVALGAKARILYGAFFVAMWVTSIHWPVRVGGIALALFATFLVCLTFIVPPFSLITLLFWLSVLIWTIVAIVRAFTGHRVMLMRKADQ